jgi:hypothetical protein
MLCYTLVSLASRAITFARCRGRGRVYGRVMRGSKCCSARYRGSNSRASMMYHGRHHNHIPPLQQIRTAMPQPYLPNTSSPPALTPPPSLPLPTPPHLPSSLTDGPIPRLAPTPRLRHLIRLPPPLLLRSRLLQGPRHRLRLLRQQLLAQLSLRCRRRACACLSRVS